MSIDFIVSGLPRGGTTVVARLFNFHDLCYCYAHETHLVPLLHEFFSDKPLLDEKKIEYFENVLKKQNQDVLVDMTKYSIKMGASPSTLVLEDRFIKRLEAEIMSMVRSGFFGSRLVVETMSVLADVLRDATGRSVIGEKTPSNVFSFSSLKLAREIPAVAVVREPFSVIASSAKRASDPNDPYNSAFFTDIERNCGAYLDYLEAIQGLEGTQKVVRYEDLQEEPGEVISDLYRFVGLEPRQQAVDDAQRIVIPKGTKSSVSNFGREDVIKVMALTRDTCAAFGYTEDFFDLQDIDVEQARDDLFPLGIIPIRGFQDAGDSGFWLARNGEIVFYADASQKNLLLEIYSCFPGDVVGRAGAELRIFNNGRPAWEHVAPAGDCKTVASIELNEEDGLAVSPHRRMYRLQFRSSHSYRPAVWLGGFDRRELSFKIAPTR